MSLSLLCTIITSPTKQNECWSFVKKLQTSYFGLNWCGVKVIWIRRAQHNLKIVLDGSKNSFKYIKRRPFFWTPGGVLVPSEPNDLQTLKQHTFKDFLWVDDYTLQILRWRRQPSILEEILPKKADRDVGQDLGWERPPMRRYFMAEGTACCLLVPNWRSIYIFTWTAASQHNPNL